MEINLYTRIGLILAGVLLILFVNFDLTYWISRLISKKDREQFSEKDFLKMINLWYKLKNMCNIAKFEEASTKLDEVFPLLNNRNNDE